MNLVILYHILVDIVKAEAEVIKLKTLIKGMEENLGKRSSVKEKIVKAKTAIEEIRKALEEANSILQKLTKNKGKEG